MNSDRVNRRYKKVFLIAMGIAWGSQLFLFTVGYLFHRTALMVLALLSLPFWGYHQWNLWVTPYPKDEICKTCGAMLAKEK